MNEVQDFFKGLRNSIDKAKTRKTLRHLEKRGRRYVKKVESDSSVRGDLKQQAKSQYKDTVNRIHDKSKVLKK